MTPQQWLNQYYPVDAKKLVDATDEECVKHSIQKWEGLKHLEDYDLELDIPCKTVVDKDEKIILEVNGETCALCQKHPDEKCSTCPLAKYLSQPCDEGNPSLYKASMKNPNLMIEALKKCIP